MIDIKTFSLTFSAIVVAYLMMMLPMAGATEVNIMFNGQPVGSADISSSNMINKQVTVVHNPSDITWANVRVKITMSAAKLDKSIGRIYLYKCKTEDPVECSKTEPLVFESYIDTELAWSDIAAKTGASLYPQEGNILILAKLENGRDTWIGMWNRIERTDYNVFNVYGEELAEIDVELVSRDLLEPMLSYIDSYQMIPINWASSVVFKGATTLFSLGGNQAEIEAAPPSLQTAKPTSNRVTTISKEYFFVLPEAYGQVNGPIALNQNPSFTCGNGACENDLGETQSVCCYDCGCSDGQYCDMADVNTPSSGSCRAEPTGLQIVPPTIQLTECSSQFTENIIVQIVNAPSSLPDNMQARFTLNGTPYSVGCTGTAGSYSCPVTLVPKAGCGFGSYQISDNTASMTVSYSDAGTGIVKELTGNFPAITVNYNCGCPEGRFCDSGIKQCRPEGSIVLTVPQMTSFLRRFGSGDKVYLTAAINNPPSDLGVTSTEYSLGNVTYDSYITPGESGSMTCNPVPGLTQTYNCSFPLFIQNYDTSNQYVIRSNTIRFTVTYSSGAETVTKVLTSSLPDITIPSHTCGDGTCDTPDENQDNCCIDCGCPSTGQFCDPEKGCKYLDNLQLVVDNVDPIEFDDCKEQHKSYITTRIINVPSDVLLDYYYFKVGGEVMGWQINCPNPSTTTGISKCELVIPPQNGDCQGDYNPYTIGPNSLEMTMTFSDGTGSQTKTLTTAVDDYTINPTYHCGDGNCEYIQGEDASNCCVDCTSECESLYDGNGYCDYNPTDNPDGTCINKKSIRLVVDSPVRGVSLQSCEKSHIINVKAHVDNQPSNMRIENYWAEFNGASTDDLVCQQEQLYRGSNLTFNCSLRIPSEFQCVQGSKYVYEPNKLYFFISYGGGRQAMEISDDIPRVTTVQSIRSIFDIMNDIQDEMKSHLEAVKRTTEQLQTAIKVCITLMVAALIISIIIGIKGWGAASQAGKVADYAKGWGMATTGVFTMIKAICDMMTKYFETQFKLQEADMDLTQMTLCLELYQHRMDSGECRGNEMSCFSSIRQCVNEGMQAMSKSISAAGSAVQGMTQASLDLANGLQKAAEGAAQMEIAQNKMNHTGLMRVYWDGTTSKRVCGVKPKDTQYAQWYGMQYTAWENTHITFEYEALGVYPCPTGKIVYTKQGASPNDGVIPIKNGILASEFFKIDDTGKGGKVTITFWCEGGIGNVNESRYTQIGSSVDYCFCSGAGQANQGCQNEKGTQAWQCAEEWEDCPGATPGSATGQSQIAAPTVASVTPSGVIDYQAPAIRITFTKDMDMNSVRGAITLSGDLGSQFNMGLNPDPTNPKKTIILTNSNGPQPIFQAGKTYILTVSKSAKDSTNTPMASDYTTTFSTAAIVLGAPDIGVDIKSVLPNPYNKTLGGGVTLTYELTNIGGGNNTAPVQITLGGDFTASDNYAAKAIQPGETVTKTFNLDFGSTGEKTLTVSISTPGDSSTANNNDQIKLTVTQ